MTSPTMRGAGVARRIAAAAREPRALVLEVEAGQPFEEAPDVVTPPLLTVRDDVDARVRLHGQREAHRVVLRLLQLGTRHAPRRFQHVGRREPRWLRQASDDGCFEHWVFALSGNYD